MIRLAKARDELKDWLQYMRERGKSYCLTERVKVYVPTCRGRCEDAADDVRLQLTGLFGGATTWGAKGSWYDDDGKLWDEPVIVVESAHKPLCVAEAEAFTEIIDNYVKRTGEKSISIHGGNFFITEGEIMKPLFGERRWELSKRELFGGGR